MKKLALPGILSLVILLLGAIVIYHFDEIRAWHSRRNEILEQENQLASSLSLCERNCGDQGSGHCFEEKKAGCHFVADWYSGKQEISRENKSRFHEFIRTSCLLDNKDHCFEYGKYLLHVLKDPGQAEGIFGKACAYGKGGIMDACGEYARLIHRRGDLAGAIEFYEIACKHNRNYCAIEPPEQAGPR